MPAARSLVQMTEHRMVKAVPTLRSQGQGIGPDCWPRGSSDRGWTSDRGSHDLHYANGIAHGMDGRLYVNESEAGRVISFKIVSDGSLSDRRVFIRLYQMGEAPDVYPDGIKLGPNGNFYIGEYRQQGLTGGAGNILEVTPDGKIKNKYTVPSAASPNMAMTARHVCRGRR